MLTKTLTTYSSLFLSKVDKTALRIFLESSPQYPNLLSVIQTLQHLGISAEVGQCDWSYLQNLSSPFLLHLKVKSKDLLIIAKRDDKSAESIKTYNPKIGKWETKTKKDFLNAWDGIVIYTEDIPLKDKRVPSIAGLSPIGFMLIALFLTVVIYCSISIPEIMPIISGVIIGGISYLRQHISPISIIEKLCHISEATDCQKVEGSTYSSIFGVKMSTLAFTFFLSQLVCIPIAVLINIPDVMHDLYLISAVMVLPTGIYSVYSQIKVARACPLCILILLCMAVETVLFLVTPSQAIEPAAIILWLAVAAIITGYLHLISILRGINREEMSIRIQMHRLKRKRTVIKSESSTVDNIMSPIWVGNETSSVVITTIISPGCNHCRKVVAKLIDLLDKGYSFRWNIILGQRGKEDEKLIENWILRYISDKDCFIEDLSSWGHSRSMKPVRNIGNEAEERQVSGISQTFTKLITGLGITGFPRIIRNDRLLSALYTNEDLEFLISDQLHLT